VTISNRRSVHDLKVAVEATISVPPDVQVLEYDGVVIDAQDTEFLGLVAKKKGIVTVSEAASVDEAAAADARARENRWADAAARAPPPPPAKKSPASRADAALPPAPAPPRVATTVEAATAGDDDDEKCAVDGAPDEILLLDFPTAHKILVDDSIWHISKPRSCKGHALQAPILVIQLTKFQDFRRGTAQDAGQMWWRTMFVGANEECTLSHAPTEFYKWKDDKG